MIDKEKFKIIMIIVIEILCLFIVFNILLAFQYNAYAAEIEQEYSGIDILYTEEFENDTNHTYQVVTGTNINIRYGPGIKYNIYKVLKEGEYVDIISTNRINNWIKVWIDYNEYWIYDKNLKVIKRSIYNN